MEISELKNQSVQVLNLSMPDPEILGLATPAQMPEVMAVFEQAEFSLQKELDKIKAAQDKLSGLKKDISSYLDAVDENLRAKLKAGPTKFKSVNEVTYSLKVNPSVVVHDLEKLPGSCIRLKKEPEKAMIKTLIELGEISRDVAEISNSFSVNKAFPKTK